MATYNLQLARKHAICDDVVTLDFISTDGNKISFLPGQYMNIFIQTKSAGHQGKSYTILSTDDGIGFAVRKRGEFSSILHELKVGATIIADGPHGILCPREDCKSFVCIAGGIGVAPFISWLRAITMSSDKDLKIKLLISNTTFSRAPFFNDILQITKKDQRASVSWFFTRQQEAINKSTVAFHKITADDIKRIAKEMPDSDFAICGSIEFTRDMWKMVRSIGISENLILTEVFY